MLGRVAIGPPLHQPRQKWQMRQLTLMVEQKLREDEEAELELQGLGATGGANWRKQVEDVRSLVS